MTSQVGRCDGGGSACRMVRKWSVLAVCVIVGRIEGWDFFFFFKQKTAYEILTCDWSSDVCSSDLNLSRTSSNTIHAPIREVCTKSQSILNKKRKQE